MIWHVQANYPDALRCHQQALQLQEKFYPSDHIDTSHTLSCISNVFLSQKKYRRALKYYKKALRIDERHSSSGQSQTADLLYNIALTFEGLSDVESARTFYSHALEWYAKALPMPVDRHRRVLEKIQQLGEYT